MLGRNHTVLGVAAFYGTALAATTWAHHPPLTAAELVAGTFVAAGAGLAPDLDEPHSLGAHAIGPVFAHLLPTGPHRRRTHCVIAVVAIALLTWWCTSTPTRSGAAAGVFICLGLAGIGGRRFRTGGAFLCIPGGIVAGWAIAKWVPHGPWLLWAVIPAYVAHLVGDSLTPGGVPWFYPLKNRWSFPLFRTGKTFERVIVTPLCVLLAIIAGFSCFTKTAKAEKLKPDHVVAVFHEHDY